MSAQQQHTVWTAYLSSVVSTFSAGYCGVLDSDGEAYLVATSTNRTATGRRAAGIAITSGDSTNPSVELQSVGVVPASITGLGAGSASWLRVSSAGQLERCTPSGTDDIVGRCDADGTAYVAFGVFTAASTAANSAVAVSALEIDWSLGSVFTKALAAGANTFTFANATSGKVISVRVTSHAGGSTVTWPTVRWESGTPPTQSTPSKSDVYTFVHDGSNIYGAVVQDLS